MTLSDLRKIILFVTKPVLTHYANRLLTQDIQLNLIILPTDQGLKVSYSFLPPNQKPSLN